MSTSLSYNIIIIAFYVLVCQSTSHTCTITLEKLFNCILEEINCIGYCEYFIELPLHDISPRDARGVEALLVRGRVPIPHLLPPPLRDTYFYLADTAFSVTH